VKVVFRRESESDPLARQLVLAMAGGRLAVGAAAFFATRPALNAAGFPEPGATGLGLGKALGARDLTLGALTVAVREDPEALATVALVAACLDAADTAAFVFVAAEPESRRAGLASLAVAGLAAAAGFWAWRRLI
jgi:hypothetical protein